MEDVMTFQQWRTKASELRDRLSRYDAIHRELLTRECEKAGLPMMGNCIHNAAIDDDLKGWCCRNPVLLRDAKRIDRMWNDYRASTIVDNVLSRMFDSVGR
jgi:hypothetical protein